MSPWRCASRSCFSPGRSCGCTRSNHGVRRDEEIAALRDAEHLVPAPRHVELVGPEIPIPDRVVGPLHRERVPLLARDEGLLGASAGRPIRAAAEHLGDDDGDSPPVRERDVLHHVVVDLPLSAWTASFSSPAPVSMTRATLHPREWIAFPISRPDMAWEPLVDDDEVVRVALQHDERLLGGRAVRDRADALGGLEHLAHDARVAGVVLDEDHSRAGRSAGRRRGRRRDRRLHADGSRAVSSQKVHTVLASSRKAAGTRGLER